MLKHLQIKNFTIISELDVELESGLTVMTGETGAGKSILIDALQLVLGAKAETSLIRQDAERCEITATFAVKNLPIVSNWLIEQEMDEEDSCILRRTLSRDGRGRVTINGRVASLQQVRELGESLLHIHGQNQHSALVKENYQRELLDSFAQHANLLTAVRESYQNWRELQSAYEKANQQSGQDHSAQKELLHFQLQEFAQLALQENELTKLEEEHQRLAHAEQWIVTNQQVLEILAQAEEGNVTQGLQMAMQQLQPLAAKNTEMQSALECVQQALIQSEEAVAQVRQFARGLEADPERLQQIENRLRLIYDLARKHRVEAADLLTRQTELQNQLHQLTHLDSYLQELQQQLQAALEKYSAQAKHLTVSRQKSAKKLAELITEQMQLLGMPNGKCMVQCNPVTDNLPHKFGMERIEFWVNMNPGQPLQPMSKVASGGELSRISLAIQVITAQTTASPTLIFDEVDVGIGGRTAELVGQQLKQLGQRAQVFCVTHLPQVAAQGNQHLHVTKHATKNSTHTEIQLLSKAARIAEIARMLGGVKITETTLAHAEEMLG